MATPSKLPKVNLPKQLKDANYKENMTAAAAYSALLEAKLEQIKNQNMNMFRKMILLTSNNIMYESLKKDIKQAIEGNTKPLEDIASALKDPYNIKELKDEVDKYISFNSKSLLTRMSKIDDLLVKGQQDNSELAKAIRLVINNKKQNPEETPIKILIKDMKEWIASVKTGDRINKIKESLQNPRGERGNRLSDKIDIGNGIANLFETILNAPQFLMSLTSNITRKIVNTSANFITGILDILWNFKGPLAIGGLIATAFSKDIQGLLLKTINAGADTNYQNVSDIIADVASSTIGKYSMTAGGAAIGSLGGPWGAVIGAVVGFIAGTAAEIIGPTLVKENIKKAGDVWEAILGKSLFNDDEIKKDINVLTTKQKSFEVIQKENMRKLSDLQIKKAEAMMKGDYILADSINEQIKKIQDYNKKMDEDDKTINKIIDSRKDDLEHTKDGYFTQLMHTFKNEFKILIDSNSILTSIYEKGQAVGEYVRDTKDIILKGIDKISSMDTWKNWGEQFVNALSESGKRIYDRINGWVNDLIKKLVTDPVDKITNWLMNGEDNPLLKNSVEDLEKYNKNTPPDSFKYFMDMNKKPITNYLEKSGVEKEQNQDISSLKAFINNTSKVNNNTSVQVQKTEIYTRLNPTDSKIYSTGGAF